MLERIVENWLTNARELDYQAAFAQLLSSEGYRVLHSPVHHPFEHGKDTIAISAEGELHAFQLKGGDVELADLDKIQGQLFALAGTAITYPGVEPPRRPDKAFLVTNGRLSPPARDRLRSFNDANRAASFPIVEVIELDHLVGRMVEAHGKYLPHELSDLNNLLRFVLADGRGPFPVKKFAKFVWSVIGTEASKPLKSKEVRRTLAGVTIFASYAMGPWQRTENHWAVAEAWLTLAFAVLRLAELNNMEEDVWLPTFEIARDGARRALNELVLEAAKADDLVVPDIVDGTVYPTRAAVVCGYSAAFLLSESEFQEPILKDEIKRLIVRELEFVQCAGEAGVPLLIMIATALEWMGEPIPAATLMVKLAASLASGNQLKSGGGIADPYHTVNEVLLHSVGADSQLDEEDFEGESHTLHVIVDWFARRRGRPVVEKLWPQITKLHLVEFRPSQPANLLAHSDPQGEQHSWAPSMPQSWAALVREASSVNESELPTRLWQHLYMLPYLPLLFPFRMTASVGKALDYMVSGLCGVTFDDDLTDVVEIEKEGNTLES